MNPWDDDDRNDHDLHGPDESDLRDEDQLDTEPCPRCGWPVWEEAPCCPHCGHYASFGPSTRPLPVWLIVAAALAALAVLGWLLY